MSPVKDDLPEPGAELFPARPTRERIDDLLTRELADATERVTANSVMPTLDMAKFRQELAGFDFETPRPAEQVLAWSIEQLERGAVHMTHPRYFGLFNPAPVAPAQWADRIAGAFNPQLASSGSSPTPVEIEAHVIRAMARRAGLPADSAGHFTTSGSEANYTALLCALTRAQPRFGAEGVRAFSGPVAFYTSRECHPAWLKIAHQAGVGRSALRLVATDGHGRMDSEALAEAVADDRRDGVVPVLIAATAGTTGGGMIDPLERCAAIARSNGIWYHVDAAWGGAALSSDRLRGALAGIELADSLTIDAHKWFATTMGCGMFVSRDAAVLSEAFQVGGDFMPSSASSLDPYLNTVQWSRRFLGLRLFLALAVAGWKGYGAHVERAVDVVERIKVRLVSRGWSALNDSPLAVLCAAPPAGLGDVRGIVTRLLASGRAWVARTKFEGREVVRICATHGETTLADVDELVRALNSGA
ncbi:MAG TPA: pyridoxal-dependent decarboxylase [Steroidobacteraceae bacterium]|jgi:glutamate/tyrosine decarboxylase-like PLP-dependent enzyme|nr:pyridoxal-dependent decarboxylase [Steroidobacteraceae bacterium]